MEVLNRPEAGDEKPRKPEQTQSNADGWWVRGKETKIGFFAGRFAFVIVGTMLIVAVIISVFMLWVSWNEPYLQPFITDDALHVNKIYIQMDGEGTYRELAMGNQPIELNQAEITQIPVGKSFKIIFTPKQLDVPERYKIYLKQTAQEPDGGLIRQSKYLKQTVDGTYYTLTVTPTEGKWVSGQYTIEIPDSSMFGGKWFAYFTVNGE